MGVPGATATSPRRPARAPRCPCHPSTGSPVASHRRPTRTSHPRRRTPRGCTQPVVPAVLRGREADPLRSDEAAHRQADDQRTARVVAPVGDQVLPGPIDAGTDLDTFQMARRGCCSAPTRDSRLGRKSTSPGQRSPSRQCDDPAAGRGATGTAVTGPRAGPMTWPWSGKPGRGRRLAWA